MNDEQRSDAEATHALRALLAFEEAVDDAGATHALREECALAAGAGTADSDTGLADVEGWNDEVLARGTYVAVWTDEEEDEPAAEGFVVAHDDQLLLMREETDWQLDDWHVFQRRRTNSVESREEAMAPQLTCFRSEGPVAIDPQERSR